MAEAAEKIEDEEIDNQDKGPSWPEDWRNQIAGDDEKVLEQLTRYADPAAIWTKARALEQKVSSGELVSKAPYPEKGTPEEIAAWRTLHNVPESVEKYDIGREIEKEEEKEAMAKFLEFAHGKNMSNDQVKSVTEWFFTKAENDAAINADADKQDAQTAEDALRAEWGNEYRGHMNRINNLIELAPADVKGLLLDARLPGGTKLKDSAEAMKFLLGLAIIQNPVTTVVPQGGDQLSSIQDEIDEIKGKMNTQEYKAKGSKLYQRYSELLAAQQQLTPQK